MLYDYLQKNYDANQPIFLADIELPGISDMNLRKQIKTLCDNNKLMRYDTGVYYLPATSHLKNASVLAPGTVAQYKYINRKGKTEGYYSGYTFANQIGLTTQVPFTLEIVTNQEKMNYRKVDIKGQQIVLRKPRTKVTAENAIILQLLDLLKDISNYTDIETADAAKKVQAFTQNNRITRAQIDEYIPLFPDKTYRNLYEMRLYNVFT